MLFSYSSSLKLNFKVRFPNFQIICMLFGTNKYTHCGQNQRENLRTKIKMSDGNQVARALENWAVKEMGFRNTQNKDGTADTNKSFDLSGICLGPMADIWIYVMKHIKSESTVQVIKGNLRLNSKEQTDDPKKLTLISQRDKLRQEIAELKKTTSVLHESLIESKTTAQEKEQELRKQQLAFRDFKRSSVLLGSVKNNAEDSVKLFNQTTREVKKHLQSLAPEIGNETDLERYKIDIENMCKLMQNSLNELLKEEPNIEKINGTKMAVGNHLATLLETLPHPLFMKLIQEQQAAEISSRNQKEFTTPAQNDTALDFIPDNVEPLQKLLCDLSWTYTDTQTRAKNAKEKTEALKKELAEVKAEILQTLNTRFDAEDPKLAAAHLKQIETEIQVAKQKGAIDGLRKILEELEDFCTCYEARQADIEQKIVTIEGNSRLSDHLTAIICTLARKRANNPNLVQQLANQSLRMVNEDLVAIHNTLDKTIKASKGNLIEKELELYQQLKPSQLFNSNVDKKLVPVHRLAMNRLLLTTESGVSGNHIEMTLRCLGLPQSMPVLNVMEAVGNKQLQIRKMQQTLKWHKSRKSEIMEKHGVVWLENGLVHYKELSKKLEDNWNAQEVAIFPSLELRRKRMDEALKYIQDVEVALQEWCDEPAKLIDTGRVVSGKSLEQWSAEWKKSIALCRSKV